MAIGLPTDAIRDMPPCDGASGPPPAACPALAQKIREIRRQRLPTGC